MNKSNLAALILLAAPLLGQASSHLTDGEVRKIDKAANKITLRHGEIKSIEMPAMTMVFQVKDASLLDLFKTGDKVRFAVEKSGTSLVITTLEAAP